MLVAAEEDAEPATASALSDIAVYLNVASGAVDVCTFLDDHFPDDTSLAEMLEPLSEKVRDSIAEIDSQIESKLRAHRHAGAASAVRVDASLESADELAGRLEVLNSASKEAEKAARDAIEPARPFSIALDNTGDTAAALDALVLLHDSVVQLESAAHASALGIVASDADLYPGIKSALSVFDSIAGGPGLKRLPELRTRTTVASESLRQTILSEFRVLSDIVTLSSVSVSEGTQNPASKGQSVPSAKLDDAVARLGTACTVAAAIGDDVKGEVVGAHIRGRMMAFRAAFEMDKSGMLSIERRFSWIRRELRSNWAQLGGESTDCGWGIIFPASWDVAWRVASAAMREVRTWVCSTLDAGADRDVVAMVGALSKSKDFEAELDKRFSRMGVKVKPAENGREPFSGSLSVCFGPYMSSYVEQEDEHLRIAIVDLLRSETWACADGSVLKSSTDMFLAIKKSMRMCAALDSRQSLFSLYKVFRKHIGSYATELVRRVPAPVPVEVVAGGVLSTSADADAAAAKASAESMNKPEFQSRIDTACALIATADYCATTVEQLEESLREIVEEAYAEEVSFEKERERFSTLVAKAVRSLVAVVVADLRGSLGAVGRLDWANWNAVGDSSAFVEEVSSKLALVMPTLSSKLTKPHMRFFLERLAIEFVPVYSECLYSCGCMNHTGAQQLLLDSTALKGHLLNVPSLANAASPATFLKFVNREMAKIESMLKVVLAPADMTVGAYVALVPEGSAADLRRVLETKGLSRAESAPLLLEYTRLVGPQHGLDSSSPLSTGAARPPPLDANLSAPDSIYGDNPLSGAPGSSTATAESGVESVRALLRGFGTSWGTLRDANITDRLQTAGDRFNESLESTAEVMKKRFGTGGGPS